MSYQALLGSGRLPPQNVRQFQIILTSAGQCATVLDRLTLDHVEAITAFMQLEMLEAGYLTNAESHYLDHQPGGCDRRELTARQIRFWNALGKFQALHYRAIAGLFSLPDDTRYGVAPHTLRAVGVENLRSYGAAFPAGPIHLHFAEQSPKCFSIGARGLSLGLWITWG